MWGLTVVEAAAHAGHNWGVRLLLERLNLGDREGHPWSPLWTRAELTHTLCPGSAPSSSQCPTYWDGNSRLREVI